jgi:hypothetical protein
MQEEVNKIISDLKELIEKIEIEESLEEDASKIDYKRNLKLRVIDRLLKAVDVLRRLEEKEDKGLIDTL